MDQPSRRVRLPTRTLWLIAAGVVLVAVLGLGAALVTIGRGDVHSGGDPQGRMLAQLRPVATAVPPGAQVLRQEERDSTWTVCAGQPRSGGWTWVDVAVNFQTSLPPAAVADAVDRQLSQTGWGRGPEALTTPSGGDVTWVRRLADGTRASTRLYPAGKPGVWWLNAMAPPAGTEFVASC